MTSGWVKRHIHKLQNGDVFTARELLHYGSKAAVYKTLQRCVANGSITRIAHGVYMRSYWVCNYVPLPMEVAQAKAWAIGRHIAQIPRPFLRSDYPVHAISTEICLLPTWYPKQMELLTSGRTTQFKYRDTQIVLKGSRALAEEQARLKTQLNPTARTKVPANVAQGKIVHSSSL
jgi:Family of unknown function (DUF6088)